MLLSNAQNQAYMWPGLRKSVLLPMSAHSIFPHKQIGT